MKKALIAPTAIALAVLGVGGGGSQQLRPAQASHTLTVWLMTGEISTPVSNAVNAAFQKEYPGWTVNVEIQQWSGISTKLITALASTSPPDAMEIGNTDVAEFAASGGLENLSSVEVLAAQQQQLACRALRARPSTTAAFTPSRCWLATASSSTTSRCSSRRVSQSRPTALTSC